MLGNSGITVGTSQPLTGVVTLVGVLDVGCVSFLASVTVLVTNAIFQMSKLDSQNWNVG